MRTTLVMAILALGVAVSACGGGQNTQTTPPPAGGETTTPPAGGEAMPPGAGTSTAPGGMGTSTAPGGATAPGTGTTPPKH